MIRDDLATVQYLDLMKKTLSFSLWKEPGIPIEEFNHERSRIKRLIVDVLSFFLRRGSYRLVLDKQYSEEQRTHGRIWPIQADTMIGLKRLDNIQSCVEDVLDKEIPGDLIETGVWRGGASIFMRAILAVHGVMDRRVYVADSFRGLPPPDEEKYPQDRRDKRHRHRFLAVSREDVEENFRRYGLFNEQVVFLEGWFKDTLPNAPIDRLSVMRLDGDLYQSTMESLDNLYPKLSAGGYCIIDDYAIPNCRQAVDDFRKHKGIEAPLRKIDWTGVYWQKDR